MSRPVQKLGALAIVTMIALTFLPATATAGVANQAGNTIDSVAPYYAQDDDSVRNETWMQNRTKPTLDNVTHYMTRVAGFAIGQQSAQGGVGPAGVMLFSIVLFGAYVGVNDDQHLGPVGGSVLVVSLASGVATVGLAPHWIYAVVVFILGLILSAVAIRILR